MKTHWIVWFPSQRSPGSLHKSANLSRICFGHFCHPRANTGLLWSYKSLNWRPGSNNQAWSERRSTGQREHKKAQFSKMRDRKQRCTTKITKSKNAFFENAFFENAFFENAFFENAFFENFANFWRARSRLYQNEILQENMRLTAFFKLYKICILSHRCNLKIFAKKSVWKFSNFCENSAKILQMSQNLQNFAKFQKCQLDNLVDFEKCCKTRIDLQRSATIQPKTSENLPKICQKLATTLRVPLPCPRPSR